MTKQVVKLLIVKAAYIAAMVRMTAISFMAVLLYDGALEYVPGPP